MAITRSILALVLSAAVLAGCAPAIEPSVVPTLSNGSDGSEGSVDDLPPIYHPASGYAPPKRVFGGDCNAVFTEAELSGILGAPLTFAVDGYLPAMNEYDEVGAISCFWYSEGGPGLLVDLFPVGAASYEISIACGVGIYTDIGCDLEGTHNGIQMSGAVWAGFDGRPITTAMQTQLINLFVDHATLAMSAPLVPLPPGSWNPAVDCQAVVATGDFGEGVQGYGGGGLGAYFTPFVDALIAAHRTPSTESFPGGCTMWDDSDDGSTQIFFQVNAGTRWSGQQQLDGTAAGQLDVAGVEEAWTQISPDVTIVDVFDGPNWIHITAPAGIDGVVIAKLVASLDATAIG